MLIHQADEALKNVLLPNIEKDITFERQIDREFWEAKIKENYVLQQEKIKNTEKLVHYTRIRI